MTWARLLAFCRRVVRAFAITLAIIAATAAIIYFGVTGGGAPASDGTVRVKEHQRKDGTTVPAHTRRKPRGN
jgi:hypothetical protein